MGICIDMVAHLILLKWVLESVSYWIVVQLSLVNFPKLSILVANINA